MIDSTQRGAHHQLLLAVTGIPTGAGHEGEVAGFIEDWVARRPALALRRDGYGNMEVRLPHEPAGRPLYITAHLDHPAFHVERQNGRYEIELAFRGGVMDDYFAGSRIRVHVGGEVLGATIERKIGEAEPFKRFGATLDAPAERLEGRLATWELPDPEILESPAGPMLHAPACDDLAAVAAAMATFDVLLAQQKPPGQPVRLLFTLAEEVGFIGAIGACREGWMPPSSRLIALENSRAMPEAPIGGGPIVRVGDRLSVFTPELTAAVDKRCEEIAGGAPPTASQKAAEAPAWKWQRRLMSGGACEASVFCAFGYEATCACLPLGNYHNMANLSEVQGGVDGARAQIELEHIAIADFDGLVDMLVACAQRLPEAEGQFRERLARLWEERRSIVGG